MGEMINYAANGHDGTGYLSKPKSNANGKAVIVIQEWNGLNDHIKDIADRFPNCKVKVIKEIDDPLAENKPKPRKKEKYV